ncbi:MAG: hypothetical protein ACXW12_17725 [Burkholderiales bacterium]
MSLTKASILILGSHKDPHVARVASELAARSRVEVSVLDFVAPTPCALEMAGDGTWQLRVGERLLSGPSLVWDRARFVAGTECYPEGDRVSSDYAMKEWRALYDTVSGLCEGRVVNELKVRRNLKLQQQAVAARVGLLVPPSLLTSSKAAITAFQAEQVKTIVKSISSQPVLTEALDGKPYHLFTMRASAEEVERTDPAQFALCPHFFQTELEKAYELRVVWVGTRAIGFRIHSQERALTELDWRNGLRTARYERVELDGALELRLRDFMRSIGMFTGSVDLVVDAQARAWFLEVNQNGAWAWLDAQCEGAISRLFAEEFETRACELQAAHAVD